MTYSAPVLAQHWAEVLAQLTPAERLVLPYAMALWIRPDQEVEPGPWRSHGTVAGRGFGKTHGYASYINQRVLAGTRAVGLMGPNEKRTLEVQVAGLIETSAPWCRPALYKDHLAWPNGAVAELFTAEAPDGPRGSNLELAWCTELVAWPRTCAQAAWSDLSLATRIGSTPQLLFDTTSKGRQPVVLDRVAEHRADPGRFRLRRGTTFDNPLLSQAYIDAVLVTCPPGTRRYDEEVLGKVFEEAGGALWEQAWIDEHRREAAPSAPELVILALDPARSEREDADEFGLVCASRGADRHVYVLEDHSGHITNRSAAEIIVDRCARDAAGFVWETNNVGKAVVELIGEIARQRGMVLHKVEAGRPFPRRHPGRIYVREVHTDRTKEARADAPAALYQRGQVHHVGTLPELEAELVTWEPDGRSKSPNRLDALVYAVAELGGVVGYGAPRRPQAQAAEAAKAHTVLRERLAKIGAGRTI